MTLVYLLFTSLPVDISNHEFWLAAYFQLLSSYSIFVSSFIVTSNNGFAEIVWRFDSVFLSKWINKIKKWNITR